jgi:acyl-coenzyme A synthetase/AMP-(fatty) acid ligase
MRDRRKGIMVLKRPFPGLFAGLWGEKKLTVATTGSASAVIGDLNFIGMLPKTRSGKIMRRVLKAAMLDREPGDITTIEGEGSIEVARQAWVEMKSAVAIQKSNP